MKHTILFFTMLLILSSCDKDCNDANPAPDGSSNTTGKVVCINNMPFEGAQIVATLKSGGAETATSDSDGAYAFNADKDEIATLAFSFDNNRALRLVKDDLETMRDYVLGKRTDFTDLQLLTMDLNNTNTITSLDIVLAEKMIDGENNPPIERWQFIRADYKTAMDPAILANTITVFDHIDIPTVYGLHKADPDGKECP